MTVALQTIQPWVFDENFTFMSTRSAMPVPVLQQVYLVAYPKILTSLIVVASILVLITDGPIKRLFDFAPGAGAPPLIRLSPVSLDCVNRKE